MAQARARRMNAATGTICRCAVMRWMLAPLAAGLIAFAPRAAPADQRVELHSRDGVVQAIDFIPVADPVATVILFPGGGGVIAQSRKNFVVRVRHRFAAHGFNVAVADAPSDQSGRMGAAFRASAQQAQDVAAIIAFVRSKAAVPVWLIGTSMRDHLGRQRRSASRPAAGRGRRAAPRAYGRAA